MADWQKVGAGEQYPKWEFKEVNDTLEGVMVERRENVGPNNSMLYVIEQSSGKRVSVWGKTVLDIRLKNVNIGDEVKLVYLGKAKNDKTGRTYTNFDVFHKPPEA